MKISAVIHNPDVAKAKYIHRPAWQRRVRGIDMSLELKSVSVMPAFISGKSEAIVVVLMGRFPILANSLVIMQR